MRSVFLHVLSVVFLSACKLLEGSLISETAGVYKYEIAVCSIFKDEAPYLKEWIEYNKLIGVQHFRLYNNESTDNYLEVLDPYIKAGEVVVVDWPGGHGNWCFAVQAPAIFDAVTNLRGVTKWLAIIDIDEFILPMTAPDLTSFLKDYEMFAAVVINWLHFGTSWIDDIPKNMLMIEALTLRSREQDQLNRQVKSIVRPEQMDTSGYVWPPHVWQYLPGCMAVAPNKTPFVWGPIDLSLIRVNHYITRTENYLINHKVAKKARMEHFCTKEFIENWRQSCNVEVDTSIYRFVPALREKIFGHN